MSQFIKITEVSPRDGLQNEKTIIPTDVKIRFINELSKTGLRSIEVTSFVSATWIPQLADASEVYHHIDKVPGIHYPVLVPNLKGLDNALAVGANTIALFTAASQTFCQKNINCSIEESLLRFKDVIEKAKQHQCYIRAYISCIVDCPYEGFIEPELVAQLSKQLIELGCDEISLGETLGTATPNQIIKVIQSVGQQVSRTQLALHCHNTYNMAIANIYAALNEGITHFDASVGALGGCPYAQGATGNVATEDVVYLLEGLGYETGVDLKKLGLCAELIKEYL